MSETPWPHFTSNELTCHCGCNRMEMDPGFMDRLEQLRASFDKPMRISSGFRCPNYNAMAATTGLSGPHTTGRAVDVAIAGEEVFHIVKLAGLLGFTGIGLRQHGSHNRRFIHLDDIPNGPGRPRPRIWTY